jgi:hypothetical protein
VREKGVAPDGVHQIEMSYTEGYDFPFLCVLQMRTKRGVVPFSGRGLTPRDAIEDASVTYELTLAGDKNGRFS